MLKFSLNNCNCQIKIAHMKTFCIEQSPNCTELYFNYLSDELDLEYFITKHIDIHGKINGLAF